ncbi:MAG TPA: hypothetical protein VMS22_24785, partial [Candidatus Eisenbacteria bacterium]|nr:hypothetical protein [Candidatus Eisenbacteria bacterium]
MGTQPRSRNLLLTLVLGRGGQPEVRTTTTRWWVLPLTVLLAATVAAAGAAADEATALRTTSLGKARLSLRSRSSTVAQSSAATWALSKVGAISPTNDVTWNITATQSSTGDKKLVVTGKVTIRNNGLKSAPIGNMVVTLQHKPANQWVTLSSDIANATSGDAAVSAKIVKWTNNNDDSDGLDDDDIEPGDSFNVTTMDENSASGPLTFTNSTTGAPINLSPQLTLAPGASVNVTFTATYDNNVMNLPTGRKIRAQLYVSFGNAGLGWNTAPNLDINGNGTIDPDEARVRTVSARFGQKLVPAPTPTNTPVTLSDTAGDITTSGTVSYTNAV